MLLPLDQIKRGLLAELGWGLIQDYPISRCNEGFCTAYRAFKKLGLSFVQDLLFGVIYPLRPDTPTHPSD